MRTNDRNLSWLKGCHSEKNERNESFREMKNDRFLNERKNQKQKISNRSYELEKIPFFPERKTIVFFTEQAIFRKHFKNDSF